MFRFLKRNKFLTFIFIVTLISTFTTFLTFINKSFVTLNENNLLILIITNIILLIIFFGYIFFEIKNSIKSNINVRGSIANRKYIVFFSLFTLIPSVLISIFSLFLFSFALEKYFDEKITTAVNNSYDLARIYVNEKRNKIESDIILVSFDLNKNYEIFKNDKKKFQNYLNTQRVFRNLDQIHILDNNKKILFSSSQTNYQPVEKKAFEMVKNDDRPLKIINAFENKSAAVIKLQSFENTFLYIVKFLDQRVSDYLKDSEEAVNFYYTVESQNTGIKLSFAIIYILIVSLLLFLAITIAVRFSSRFFISINNLITASESIGKGNLDIKVPELKADTEMEVLNSNFNAMIEKLKNQQDKLLISERHEAWESIARKLAHEIKNPLTPIQLTIDNLRSKYQKYISPENKRNYENNLKLILKQIKQIENLVNEFSDFARMPKPLFQKNDFIEIVNANISLLKSINAKININFQSNNEKIHIFCDYEQMNRVIFNLIKNSIESILEKADKSSNSAMNINIEISTRRDYIILNIIDTGVGFDENKIKELTKPYYTTKKKGTGLGLSIVNKIVNDHNGSIKFSNLKEGAKIQLILPIEKK
tara:strand:+ start:2588 stop:4366 length:1779 start_codon:yes stop_codon:yes gene_type:complete